MPNSHDGGLLTASCFFTVAFFFQLWFTLRIWKDKRPLHSWKKKPSEYHPRRLQLWIYANGAPSAVFLLGLAIVTINGYCAGHFESSWGIGPKITLGVGIGFGVLGGVGSLITLFLFVVRKPMPSILTAPHWRIFREGSKN